MFSLLDLCETCRLNLDDDCENLSGIMFLHSGTLKVDELVHLPHL